jgi:hypothetical protein
MIRKIKFLPKDVYGTVLDWAVIATFDILIEYGNQGYIFVKRKIAPYKNVWAFPGLRMMKSEEINDSLERIAYKELGLKINFEKKVYLGQFVGKFKTEHNHQDLSTGFYIKIQDNKPIKLNKEHFYAVKVAKTLPVPIGAMYKFYFQRYAELLNKK